MRDIRQDLQERLDALEDEAKDIRRLLDRENAKFATVPAKQGADAGAEKILSFLSGSGKTKEEINAHFNWGGRVTHGILLGLQNRGLVVKLADKYCRNDA